MGGTYVVLVHKNGSIVFVASRLLLKIVQCIRIEGPTTSNGMMEWGWEVKGGCLKLVGR